jgi:hypothetical protein
MNTIKSVTKNWEQRIRLGYTIKGQVEKGILNQKSFFN